MKGEEGVWGASPPEANGMKRSQIKWKLLLFDESDFFSFVASLFFISLLIEPCYSFSHRSRNVYSFENQTILLNGQA